MGNSFRCSGRLAPGKTTCLRMIAGFDRPTAGEIFLYGQDVSDSPAYERPVNTVFQDYALFPHMTIDENIAYGLMIKKVPSGPSAPGSVDEMLDLVRLPGFGHRKPSQLSGGQRQRVALARALINHPKVLLLDEPLGALDLKLRQQMQVELKTIQQQVGITFVFVTHDQEEALTMSDRIAVFNEGKVEQVGTPAESLRASFHALCGWLCRHLQSGGWRDGACGSLADPARFSIRPEKIHLAPKDTEVRGRTCSRPMAGFGMWSIWGSTRGIWWSWSGGGDLVVVEQNLKTTSMDVMKARGPAGAAPLEERARPLRGRLTCSTAPRPSSIEDPSFSCCSCCSLP